MEVLLRDLKDSDLPLIMAWRSNPDIYQGFYSQKAPLKWEEHLKWWNSRNRDWRTFVIIYDNREVGIVNVGQMDNWNPEIGYFVGEVTLWGKGIGRKAVELVCKWLKERGYEYCHTTVLKSNKRSINMLKSLDFNYACEARKGEERWEKQL